MKTEEEIKRQRVKRRELNEKILENIFMHGEADLIL